MDFIKQNSFNNREIRFSRLFLFFDDEGIIQPCYLFFSVSQSCINEGCRNLSCGKCPGQHKGSAARIPQCIKHREERHEKAKIFKNTHCFDKVRFMFFLKQQCRNVRQCNRCYYNTDINHDFKTIYQFLPSPCRFYRRFPCLPCHVFSRLGSEPFGGSFFSLRFVQHSKETLRQRIAFERTRSIHVECKTFKCTAS